MAIPATRRFVLGTALASAVTARAAFLLQPQPQVADPYAEGAVLRGRGTRTTVLDPTDAAFGAKGDGIILGDLAVQAGSSTVRSASGPFTTTEEDRGKLVIWRSVGDAVGTGVIESVRSATEAVLRSPASASSQQDGGPNTNGAVGTDNTAALNRAFAAAQAASARVVSDRRRQIPTTVVRLPRGVFLLTALDPFEQAGVTVAGESRSSTILASGADRAWMQLSAFNASPPDAFQGTATDWTFRDLHFMNPAFGNGSSEGNRTGRAIQDNGSGGTRIISCIFTGLSYGFCGAHGSDFSEIRGSNFANCDVGFYFGPGSQQLEITKTDAAQCREGAVFEGAPQWHLGASSFEDPAVAAITIEARPSGSTRIGVPVDLGGAFYAGKFLVDQGTWFETNSGGNGRFCPRMIWVRGDGPFGAPVAGVIVRDAYVIAGGTQQEGGTNCFLELDSDRDSPEAVVIEDLVMGGSFFNSVYRMSGKAASSGPRLVGTTVPDGVALIAGPAAGAKIVLRDGTLQQQVDIAPARDTAALRLTRSGGSSPLLEARSGDEGDLVSGIASRGALLEAFASTTTAGGVVQVDARAANHLSCVLTGGTANLRITGASRTTSQRLTVELLASGGARRVSWPSDCRFADAAPPATVQADTRTTVTLLWHPVDRVWVETARTTAVPR